MSRKTDRREYVIRPFLTASSQIGHVFVYPSSGTFLEWIVEGLKLAQDRERGDGFYRQLVGTTTIVEKILKNDCYQR